MSVEATHGLEVRQGERFAFGENWRRFLSSLTEEKIRAAEDSLKSSLNVESLSGRTFLDIGSGSGLFSLAAYNLGAAVTSFDYDAESVACTQALFARFGGDASRWSIGSGSALNLQFLESLGSFDVVYSWGVLHHTGDMWTGLDFAARRVAPEGQLMISIYNDQGWRSRYWRSVKKQYNRRPWLRPLIVAAHAPTQLWGRYLYRALRGRLKLDRGMSLYHDMIDWLGGYPFEVARPDQIVQFYTVRGFRVEQERTVGHRQGCNEFVFRRASQTLESQNP